MSDEGARTYVAPDGYPDGAAVLMYVQAFLYRSLAGDDHGPAHDAAVEVSGCVEMRMSGAVRKSPPGSDGRTARDGTAPTASKPPTR